MNNTYIFRGTIEAVEPLATASKELIDSHKKIHGAYSPLPVPSFDTEDGKRLYFPASGLRGTLRRALRDVMRDNVIQRGGKGLLLDEHYLLTLGGIKGSGAESRSTVAHEEEWRKRNVLLSLFGAGDAGVLNFVTGKAAIGNALCPATIKPMTLSGVRSDDLFRDRKGLNFLVESEFEELVARSEGNAKASKLRQEIGKKEIAIRNAKRANDDADSLIKELEALNKDLEKTLKDSKADSVSVGMPLAGYQAIPPMSKMEHSIKIFNASLLELGGMLAALNQFSLNPIVGAHKASGCGEVQAKYEVLKVTDTGLTKVASIEVGGFEPMRTTESTDEFEAATSEFAKYLSGDNFDISIPHAL